MIQYKHYKDLDVLEAAKICKDNKLYVPRGWMLTYYLNQIIKTKTIFKFELVLAFDDEVDKCVGVCLMNKDYCTEIFEYLAYNNRDTSKVEKYALGRYGLLLCFVKTSHRRKGIGSKLL